MSDILHDAQQARHGQLVVQRGRRRARRPSVIVTARRPLRVHARTVQDNASRLVNITNHVLWPLEIQRLVIVTEISICAQKTIHKIILHSSIRGPS